MHMNKKAKLSSTCSLGGILIVPEEFKSYREMEQEEDGKVQGGEKIGADVVLFTFDVMPEVPAM